MRDNYRKYDFWLFTSLDTFLSGSVLTIVDAIFDGRLPRLLTAFNPPYLAIWMLLFGGFSVISLSKGMNLVIVVSNLAFWSFILISSIFEVFDQHSVFLVLPAILSVMSGVLVMRILVEALRLNLKKK